MALILGREVGQEIIINGDISVQVIEINNGNYLKFAITAPANVSVDRKEIHDKKAIKKAVKTVVNRRKLQ